MISDERKSCQDWLYQMTNTLFVAFGQPFITQRRPTSDASHHSWSKIMYIKLTGIMLYVWWNSIRTSPRYWHQGFLSAANLFPVHRSPNCQHESTTTKCTWSELMRSKSMKKTLHTFTVPSEDADAKTASCWDTMIAVMQVTPFLWACGTCKTYLHYRQKYN